jgi:hypothetical protein
MLYNTDILPSMSGTPNLCMPQLKAPLQMLIGSKLPTNSVHINEKQAQRRYIVTHAPPDQNDSPVLLLILYVMTSPGSTIFGFHLPFGSPASTSLGTTTFIGLYKYQPFNAAVAALFLASSKLPPAPSPNLSLPENTPTTNTGCALARPVSLINRATGGSNPSLKHNRERSRVGYRKSNNCDRFSVRERK